MKRIILFLMFLLVCGSAHAQFQGPLGTQPYLYKFSSLTTVTTVKSKSGFLHTLTIEGGTTSPIDIYDGTPVSTAVIASYATTNTAQTYFFDAVFTSGCTVVTNGGLKYSVSYL